MAPATAPLLSGGSRGATDRKQDLVNEDPLEQDEKSMFGEWSFLARFALLVAVSFVVIGLGIWGTHRMYQSSREKQGAAHAMNRDPTFRVPPTGQLAKQKQKDLHPNDSLEANANPDFVAHVKPGLAGAESLTLIDPAGSLMSSLPRNSLEDKQLLRALGKSKLMLPKGPGPENLPALTVDPMFTYGDKDMVSRIIIQSGAWEPELLQNIRAQIRKAGPATFFFDLGMNIGDYTLVAAKEGIPVFAFEMMKSSWYKAVASAQSNNIADKIHLIDGALAEAPNHVVDFISHGGAMHKPDKDNVGGTEAHDTGAIAKTGLKTCPKERRGISCSTTTTMDKLLKEGAFKAAENKPIVMKIDIEGHECNMLQGAKNFFAKFGPHIQYLQVEIWHKNKLLEKCKPMFDTELAAFGLQPVTNFPHGDDYFYERPAASFLELGV